MKLKEIKKTGWIFLGIYASILAITVASVFFYIQGRGGRMINTVVDEIGVDISDKEMLKKQPNSLSDEAARIVGEVQDLEGLSPLVEELIALKKEMLFERIDTREIEIRLEEIARMLKEGDIEKGKEELLALISFMRDALSRERAKPAIAFTFDAGAGAEPVEDLISYLRESRVKITFFSTGKWAEQNPELFKEILIVDEETTNILGNHTYSHPHLATGGLSDDQIREEIIKTENIFKKSGFSAKPYFRYPYGERDARTDAIVANLGYVAVGWAFDSLGWKGTPSDEIVERVVAKTKPGDIVLMHVGSPEDVAAFPRIVERLKGTYRFVFVSELPGN